jgi:hypothetical protein
VTGAAARLIRVSALCALGQTIASGALGSDRPASVDSYACQGGRHRCK